jgi:hypothetical protein
MRFVVLLGLMILAVTQAAPASAQSFSRNVGNWHIYGGYADGGTGICIMEAEYRSGTTIQVTRTGDSDQREMFYFNFHNPAWTSIRNGAEYRLNIEIDRLGSWNINAKGVSDSQGTPGLIFGTRIENTDGDSFIAEFAIGNTLRVSRSGTQIGSWSLRGTRAAIDVLIECSNRMPSRNQPDPFAVPDRPRENLRTTI